MLTPTDREYDPYWWRAAEDLEAMAAEIAQILAEHVDAVADATSADDQ